MLTKKKWRSKISWHCPFNEPQKCFNGCCERDSAFKHGTYNSLNKLWELLLQNLGKIYFDYTLRTEDVGVCKKCISHCATWHYRCRRSKILLVITAVSSWKCKHNWSAGSLQTKKKPWRTIKKCVKSQGFCVFNAHHCLRARGAETRLQECFGAARSFFVHCAGEIYKLFPVPAYLMRPVEVWWKKYRSNRGWAFLTLESNY